jgi:hypothetical protein
MQEITVYTSSIENPIKGTITWDGQRLIPDPPQSVCLNNMIQSVIEQADEEDAPDAELARTNPLLWIHRTYTGIYIGTTEPATMAAPRLT